MHKNMHRETLLSLGKDNMKSSIEQIIDAPKKKHKWYKTLLLSTRKKNTANILPVTRKETDF